MDVSIVIPVFNTASLIEDTVGRLVRYIKGKGITYEIIFGDDASRDNSAVVLERMTREYPDVRYIVNPTNQGLGVTLRRLLAMARGEHVIYCDCDLPFGEDVIGLLLKKAAHSDIVVASRYDIWPNTTSLLRKIVSRMYFHLCRLLFQINIKDIGSGSVLMKRDLLPALNLRARGFDIHIEILSKASLAGYRIKEVGHPNYINRIHSFSIWRHGWPVVARTCLLWYHLNQSEEKISRRLCLKQRNTLKI